MLTRCFFPIDPPTSPPLPHLSQRTAPQARHCNPVYLLPITFTTLYRDTNLSRSITRQQPESILRKICQCSSRDIEPHPRCNSLGSFHCEVSSRLVILQTKPRILQADLPEIQVIKDILMLEYGFRLGIRLRSSRCDVHLQNGVVEII